jgi:Na+/melibiose symporter-like transporter
VRGLSPLESGAMVLPFAVAQLIFSSRSAGMVRRFGAKAVCTVGLLLVAVALVLYEFIDTTSPLWVLGVIFFIQGVGMANVMPPATESVMSALPREKAGAGSAINNTARQVAVALGVAVLGSVVASFYRNGVKDDVASLPPAAREAASQSVEGGHHVGKALGPNGQTLIDHANSGFMNGMHAAALAAAAIAFIGAMVVLKWMPGRSVDPAAETAAPVAQDERKPAEV